MDLINLSITIARTFTAQAVVNSDEDRSKTESDFQDWCEGFLEDSDYREDTDIDGYYVNRIRSAEAFSHVVSNTHTTVLLRDDDGDLVSISEMEERPTCDQLFAILEKEKEDKEYEEFMEKQLILVE